MRVFKIDFCGNLKKYLIFSAALLAVILVGLIVFGVELDIQFRGGSMLTYEYQGDFDQDRFQSVVTEELGGNVNIQYSSDLATGMDTTIISLPGTQSLSADELSEFTAMLQQSFPDNSMQTAEITNIDATIGKEFLIKCMFALLLAIVLMLLYVAWRFRKIGGLSAGAMGVVALIHDCIIIFGVFVLFRIPLNSNFIAAILTIIGYSLNDTIVIYDRIRENKRLIGSKMNTAELVNLSINQSLVRSINTSVTTVMAMIVVTVVAALYGVESIFSFSFPLILGLASGTYSSVCLAGPLWVKWQERKQTA